MRLPELLSHACRPAALHGLGELLPFEAGDELAGRAQGRQIEQAAQLGWRSGAVCD
jgi:hypothetical protein